MNQVQSNPESSAEAPTLVPQVDVLEDASGLTLLVDMPGVAKDAIELKLEGNALSIAGDIAAPAVEGLQTSYAEIHAGRSQDAAGPAEAHRGSHGLRGRPAALSREAGCRVGWFSRS